ncbi:MAG: hypothetical protein K8R36_04240 [Planctomycetales bacterium]|nr:hypothetical protein [Planctomycetales bacterium]
MLKFAAYLWASPWTVFGICWGILALVTGGRVQMVQGIIEFHGGFPAWLLRRAPLIGGAAAITFGHTVLARTIDDLDNSRSHEQVHVRQYERWGLFFIPAYLLCSLWLLLRLKRPYWDNPFEKEAYAKE